MGKTIYEVAVNCEDCMMGPHRITVLVVAEDEHTALDRATEHQNAKELWDEEIQRAIVDDKISDNRVERKYSDYITEVEYVGSI